MAVGSARIHRRLWFIPVLCVAAGVALSLATVAIDRRFDFALVPRWLTGDPSAAMGMLTTVAGSMVSLAGLVLTITMVVVQLAMGQFSPRIVQTFLQDRPSQLAIGLFVATFAHAIITMQEVSDGPPERVPGVAIVTAYGLVLLSIAMLVLYVDHIGRSLRVSSLIELVGNETRTLLESRFPDALGDSSPPPDVILAPRSGVVTEVLSDDLVELARRADVVLEVQVGLGEYVAAGAPLVRVLGSARGLDEAAVRACLKDAPERSLDQDVAYGIRLLVDVAERCLAGSPFLDPTTAVQCIDRLHDVLRQLAARRIPDGRHVDGAGVLRVTVPTMGWDDYVNLAFEEVRLAGAESPQIARRLRAALDDLLCVAPEDRRPVLREQLRRLEGDVADEGHEGADQRLFTDRDPRGIG